MSRKRLPGTRATLKLSEGEAALITSLCEQLVGLLEADQLQVAGDDPFAVWEAELAAPSLDRSDPVLARLFPSAYEGDDLAEADFRRYTENDQRRSRINQAHAVIATLASADPKQGVQIAEQDVDAWLKTLTALRLSLATRLGIESDGDVAELAELPESDPRALLAQVFEWLGYLLEQVLAQL